MGRSVLLLGLWLVCELTIAHGFPRQSKQASARRSAEWEFLTFSQIWPATFCQFEKCDFPETYTSWNIHGLWPSVMTGKDPEFCEGSPAFDFTVLQPIYNDLADEWMDLKNYQNPRKFWTHEWDAHGSCAITDERLLNQLTYFNATLLLKKLIQTRNRLDSFGIKPIKGNYIESSDLLDAIRSIYRADGEIRCLKHHGGDYYLYEIRLCFDPDLILMDCPKRHGKSHFSDSIRNRRHAAIHNLTASSVDCGDRILYEPTDYEMLMILSDSLLKMDMEKGNAELKRC